MKDQSGLTVRTTTCPECGATVQNGAEGCKALWDKITARVYSGLSDGNIRDLAFDAYCMQHPERYCRSAKSYVAHLARLCCGIEFAGSPSVYSAIQRWLNGNLVLHRPTPPVKRGEMTVTDLVAGSDNSLPGSLVQSYADTVWEAYTEQQGLARDWIQTALRR